jgi:uncharacterized iron-regulated membrane protein
VAARAGGDGSTFVALIVGALVAAAAGIGWMVWSGRTPAPEGMAVELSLPEAPDLPRPAPIPDPQPTPLPLPTPQQPR